MKLASERPILMRFAPILPPEGAQAILNAVPMPILCLSPQDGISYANLAAESFFELSLSFLRRQKLSELFAFDLPVVSLVAEVTTPQCERERASPPDQIALFQRRESCRSIRIAFQ